jgi:hypothetical protein
MPNALYRPSVDNAVAEMFGMQPGMDRLNLLPRHDKRQGWIAPNALYQLARAAVAPGVAARGGDVSPEDALNFAGNVSLGSYAASRALPPKGPGKTVGMNVYHYTKANISPDELSPGNRGAVFVSTDPKAAMYGAVAGRNEQALGGINMGEIENPLPLSDSSLGKAGDRIFPLYMQGKYYGHSVPEKLGPIQLPPKVDQASYSALLKQADNLTVPGLSENATIKARKYARATITHAYDDAGNRLEFFQQPKRGNPVGIDYQSFEGRKYPDVKNPDGSSAVISALKALGYDGASLLDEGSIYGASSFGVFDPKNLKSKFAKE